MSHIRAGKAAGEDQIAPELLKSGGTALRERLLKLFQLVWNEGSVPQAWKDAVIVPLPKKGDLSITDNWRGISLLAVAGKVLARLLQNRLQNLAETVLEDSQCGFRPKRGTIDMVFAARQLTEKSIEYRLPLYWLFVDLKKAYDSVNRDAMWTVLQKYGVPDRTIAVIRSFHVGMQAKVRVNGQFSEAFEVVSGLRQGCCLAPLLFNLYVNLILQQWRQKSGPGGVRIQYSAQLNLRQGKRQQHRDDPSITITETQFADDLGIPATSRTEIVRTLHDLVQRFRAWGLTVSIPKTKLLVTQPPGVEVDRNDIHIGNATVESVTEFKYLGSTITCSNSLDAEIRARIDAARKTFWSLNHSVFQQRGLTVRTKERVYCAAVLGSLLYGSETWTPLSRQLQRMQSFHNGCVRAILGVSRYQQWEERIQMGELHQKFGMQETIESLIRRRRLRWLGHTARMEEQRMPRQLLQGRPQDGARPRCKPKRRWLDQVTEDMENLQLLDSWGDVAQNRQEWRTRTQVHIPMATHRPSTKRRTPAPISPDLTCQQCLRTFTGRSAMSRHKCEPKKQRLDDRQPNNGTGRYVCLTCNRTCGNQSGLTRHQKQAHGTRHRDHRHFQRRL